MGMKATEMAINTESVKTLERITELLVNMDDRRLIALTAFAEGLKVQARMNDGQ